MDNRTRFRTGLSVPLFSLIAISFVTLSIGVSRLFYPYDVGHYEGGIWMPASIAFSGRNPYHVELTRHAPYVMAPYGPVYYWLIGLGLSIFGLQFWFGRAASILCVIFCAYCIGKMTRQFTGDRWMAILSMAVFLCQFPVQAWIGVQRPDFIALALNLVGLTIALRQSQSRVISDSSVCLAGLLFVAAIMCRQTAFLPVLVLSGWYLMHRMHRQLLEFLAIVAIALSFTIHITNSTSEGGYLWQSYVLPAGVVKSATNMIVQIRAILVTPAFWVAIVTAGWLLWNNINFMFILRQRDLDLNATGSICPSARRYFLLLIGYFASAVVLGAITCSRAGANVNYWLEACAAIALLLPAAWADTVVRTRVDSRMARSLVLLGLLLSASFMGIRSLRGEYFRWRSMKYFNEIVNAIELNANESDPCFSVFPELITCAGRPYWFNDFVQYDGRSKSHERLLNYCMKSRSFSAIVKQDQIPPEGYRLAAILEPPPERFYKVYLFLREGATDMVPSQQGCPRLE